jgi:ubiquinone/menaquinone biosynthesis C-methylase UbiE
MKLNKLEFMAMNSPVRYFIQERYELRILRSMGSKKSFQSVLEIGCGNGNGTRLIKKYFSPNHITAIDLDEKMIRIAQKRNKDSTIIFKTMDASNLDFSDQQFDAIFDFGIIHHIPDWRACLHELKRVLKPDGELLIEDLSLDSFTKGIGRLWKIVSDHPYESMYTAKEFKEYLIDIGFTIVNYKQSNPLKLVKFFSLTAIIDQDPARSAREDFSRNRAR